MPSSENVGIKRYRKRPIEIIAVQWTGKNLKEIVDFLGLEIGDFIIKNLDGCFFPYSPGAFYMEYEEVR